MYSTMNEERMEEVQQEVQEKCECLIPDRVGRYIPQEFAEKYGDNITNRDALSDEDIEIVLEGPESEFYWQAWDNLLQSVRLEIDGTEYIIAQNGDLFAIEPDLSDDAWDMFYV